MFQSVQPVSILSLCPPPSEDPQNDRAIFRKNLYTLALEKIPSIETKENRFRPYLLIAQAQLEDGYKEESQKTFTKALSTYKRYGNVTGDQIALALAYVQFRPRNIDIAIKEAYAIWPTGRMQFETLGEIASMCIEQDAVLEKVKKLADEDPLYSIVTRITIAKAQFQNNFIDRAKNTLEEVEKIVDEDPKRNPSQKSQSYRLIAEGYIQIGDIVSATTIINKLSEAQDISTASRLVAVALGKAGDLYQSAEYFRNALAAAIQIQRKDRKSYALKEIAVDQLNLGYKDAVRPILIAAAEQALGITNPNQQYAALLDTARLQHQIQDFENAEKTFIRVFSAIPSSESYQNLQIYYLQLFKAQYQIDRIYASATCALDKIGPKERKNAQQHIIEVQAQNNIEKALSMVDQEISEEADKHEVIKSITENFFNMHIRNSNIHEAIELVDGIEDSPFKYRALKIIVLEQAKLNDIAGVDQNITALAKLGEQVFDSLDSFVSMLTKIATILPKN